MPPSAYARHLLARSAKTVPLQPVPPDLLFPETAHDAEPKPGKYRCVAPASAYEVLERKTKDLERRLKSLRDVKLELEEWNLRKRRQCKRLLLRLARIYTASVKHPLTTRARQVFLVRRMRTALLRLKELNKAYDQKVEDCDRLSSTVGALRGNFTCFICKEPRKHSQMAMNPAKPLGVDTHCKQCARDKVAHMRAKKSHAMQKERTE
jgi:hypothetical protein